MRYVLIIKTLSILTKVNAQGLTAWSRTLHKDPRPRKKFDQTLIRNDTCTFKCLCIYLVMFLDAT